MSIRREVRLRKEFLFKKQSTAALAVRNEKKRRLKHAIDTATPVPTELRGEARELQHEMELDLYDNTGDKEDTPALDDEYANIGHRDPKVCITTSRDPSSRLKMFAKEIKLCIPNAQAINRGGYRMDELVGAAKKNDFTDVVVLNETRGNPDSLIVSHLPFGPTTYFTLTGTVLRHDIPEVAHASQVRIISSRQISHEPMPKVSLHINPTHLPLT
jgi:U3 small nucleolar ribonucleoprotein protein IMP4